MNFKRSLIKSLPHLAFLGATLGSAALLVAAAHAQSPWRIAAGTNQSPQDYITSPAAPCAVDAVYHWDYENEKWLLWFNVGPELAFLNDEFHMDGSKGYWIRCQ